MQIYNHTTLTAEQIRQRVPVGMMRSNWRGRHIEMYATDDPEKVFLIGTTFDKHMQVITLEAIGMNERQAMAIYPRTLNLE